MEFKSTDSFGGVKIFSSEANDGEMSYLSADGPKNLKRYLAKIGVARPFVSASQPHETKIEVVSRAGRVEGADGLITKDDLTLAVKTADCIPLMLFDRKNGAISAIHVSRQNLTSGIISKSLKSALENQKLDPADVSIFFGPHIHRENYQVKDEVIEKLVGTKWEQFLSQKDDKTFFDLAEAAKSELEAIGLKRDNIVDCGIDTFTDNRFYSARRQAGNPSARFVTVIFKV